MRSTRIIGVVFILIGFVIKSIFFFNGSKSLTSIGFDARDLFDLNCFFPPSDFEDDVLDLGEGDEDVECVNRMIDAMEAATETRLDKTRKELQCINNSEKTTKNSSRINYNRSPARMCRNVSRDTTRKINFFMRSRQDVPSALFNKFNYKRPLIDNGLILFYSVF